MKKIFVNGYGSIGSRITSFLKDDPEITVIGVGKYSSDEKVNVAISRGLDVYVPERKLDAFSDYEIYIWSSFPFKTDSDVDIIFVGEVTETLGKRLHELSEKINLDITVLPTTRIFSYIPDFDRCKPLLKTDPWL